MIIISDLHGCWFTLTRLLNKCPRGHRLVLCGDLIDRGPHSRLVVEFAMNNAIPTVRANHDDLCVDFYRGPTHSKCGHHYTRGVWLDNGGDAAIPNWPLDPVTNPARVGWQGAQDSALGGRIPDSVLDWMESLPAYIRFDAEDGLDSTGRALLASHTGYGLDADKGQWMRALWGRHGHDSGAFIRDANTGEGIDDGLFRAFGHSVVKDPWITPTFANIDTGAAYKERGGGVMTALLWPSKELVSQEYDENPCAPKFKVSNGCIV